jgi:hypothetical protein
MGMESVITQKQGVIFMDLATITIKKLLRYIGELEGLVRQQMVIVRKLENELKDARGEVK